ncbi:venom acid phosphatase Acph-1-like [Sitophilus oryzae]|uniref:acid phosphatase n=1 Tax=Sitophilus oryzae TaxID=7048 RepID=A0A6J2YWR6_SITOR|nr:venom acid phosphatase Acph-1-like [Sitophilus oryzae]
MFSSRVFAFIVCLVSLGLLVEAFPPPKPPRVSYNTTTLQLAHVLFRHGNRNPTSGTYDSNPYYDESYYPEGYGQLTNAGKLTEFKMGGELRKRFDDFLNSTWNINYLDVRSTNVNRTKMSAELMLAGLYPARGSQIWSNLFWLPIPYNYYSSDKLLEGQSVCSNFKTLYNEVMDSDWMTEYLETRYEDLFTNIKTYTNQTGSLTTAFSLYFGLFAQEDVGYELEEWTSLIYPDPLLSATMDLYYVYTNTTALRKIVAGNLLKKILSDTEEKINGSIDPSTRKMFIYSAHEMNVANMLLTLGVEIHMAPPYGSYVLFELHLIDGVYGIKLFYQFYEEDDPVSFSLSGCDEFCPYDDFYSLVEQYIPTDDDCT